MSSLEKINKVCDSLKVFLLEKNKRYGDSALDPVIIFGNEHNPTALLNVRINDKLSRIRNSKNLRKTMLLI